MHPPINPAYIFSSQLGGAWWSHDDATAGNRLKATAQPERTWRRKVPAHRNESTKKEVAHVRSERQERDQALEEGSPSSPGQRASEPDAEHARGASVRRHPVSEGGPGGARRLRQALRDNGVEVFYLEDLMAEVLEGNPELREKFLKQWIERRASAPSATRRSSSTICSQNYPDAKDFRPEDDGGHQPGRVAHGQVELARRPRVRVVEDGRQAHAEPLLHPRPRSR